jgi:hypothetical protein
MISHSGLVKTSSPPDRWRFRGIVRGQLREVVDDFLGENVGVGKNVRVFEAFVSEQEDVVAKKLACPTLSPPK